MDAGEEINFGRTSFPTASEGCLLEAGRGEAENLAFLVGGEGSVTSSWTKSSMDVGDKRLCTGIEDLTPCCKLTWSLGEGSVDAVDSLRGVCRSRAISDGLLGVADCPFVDCLGLERALSSVSISGLKKDVEVLTLTQTCTHDQTFDIAHILGHLGHI